MGEHTVAEGRVGEFAHYGYLDHRHHLTVLSAQHRAAQDPPRACVDHDFHHPAALVHLERPRYVAHRHRADENVAPLLAGFSLAQANPPERARSCGPRCTTVTSEPKRRNIWANSRPT